MEKRKPLNSLWVMLLYLVVLTLFMLINGCQRGTIETLPIPIPEEEIDLHFETIERADSPGTGQLYDGKEPRLVVIAGEEEIEGLGDMVSLNAQIQLRNTDFSRYFAVAVFQGLKPTDSYGVNVQRVTRKGDTFIVYVHFTQRDPQLAAKDILTSPYHLVKVRKPEPLGKEIEFILNADGVVIISQRHFIP